MARGRYFQQFKDWLVRMQGYMVVVCPNARFIWWAKRMVHEVLGKPLEVYQDRWCYGDKTICFASVEHPSQEYRLRGLDRDRIIWCDGSVTDDYLGIQR